MRFFLIIFTFFVISACNTGNPKEIISPQNMVLILEDVHIVDAMLMNQSVKKGDEKAQQYYQYIFEKHHISKEKFDKSMKYYADNPKKLRMIYKNIISQIAKRDSLLKIAEKTKTDTLQLWKGATSHSVEAYTKETFLVSVPVEYQQTYTISAEIKIYEDSQIKETEPYFTFAAADTNYVLPTQKIIADTAFQKFETSAMVSDSTVFKLKGSFFPIQKDSVEKFKHYEIRKIQITTIKLNDTEKVDTLLVQPEVSR